MDRRKLILNDLQEGYNKLWSAYVDLQIENEKVNLILAQAEGCHICLRVLKL